MIRDDRRSLWLILALTLIAPRGEAPAAEPRASRQDYGPDPASVRRHGPAYRYPQDGWIVLHVEGEPYDRGYQHGRLMAPEIADYIQALAAKRSVAEPAAAWKANRTLVDALFLRRYDKEYLEEMKGTADGASAAGATFDGRPVDLLDVAAINSDIEIDSLENALEASPHGLEGRTFREPSAGRPKAPRSEHCSAFAAVGPATADGSIVFGHITMWSLRMARHFNVWLDIKPAQGHRVLMQTYPGGIQSGMDYYMNDVGLLVAETTLAQTRFDPEGQALASRIRRALQYADSIDSAVAILSKKNNGLYTNEWLLADTKTNEIAMFELGTRKSKLWRSGRKEWFGGTEGFYWGCNNAKDLDVRLETIPSAGAKPANLVFRPSDRDRAWLALFGDRKGKVDADFAVKAFTTPPLAAAPSLDAKFTTSAMARELKTRALFGPPLGRAWEPTEEQRRLNPSIRPLVGNDWTTLTAEPPPTSPDDAPEVVDLARIRPATPDPDDDNPAVPAWHGTILPKGDADTWLAAAFADYEPIAARKGEAGRADLALRGARSRYLVATRRLGRDVPLSEIRSDLAGSDWYEIAAGKGVLLLDALRDAMGPEKFAAMMDDFGRAHAGNAVDTAQFRHHAEKAAGRPLGEFFDRWLARPGLPDDDGSSIWAVDSFEREPEKALIIYGTLKDAQANREAAARLRKAFASKWSNHDIPIKSDSEATDDDCKAHHLLLIGRPAANSVAARCGKAFPITFGPGSFTLRGSTYAHAGTAVIVAAENPLNPRYEVVLHAGLGAEATWHCVEHGGGPAAVDHPEVILIAEKAAPEGLTARAEE